MLKLFAAIRTFVFDADGVLTDGSIMPAEDGHMLRSMNTKDVYALQLSIKKGYKIWILSENKLGTEVKLFLNTLGIQEVHFDIDNKKEFLYKTASTSNTGFESILYMGDDLPDYAAMQLCGLPCCPNDAVTEIRQTAKYISPINGGKGCVRDVIEKTLKLNGDWEMPK